MTLIRLIRNGTIVISHQDSFDMQPEAVDLFFGDGRIHRV